MSILPNTSALTSRASVQLAGRKLSARLRSDLPVKAVADLEVDVDVTITGEDVITVEETEKGKSVNLFILSEITEWGATDPQSLLAALKRHDPDHINIYIGSIGGDMWVAMRIYDILRGHRATVTAYLTGLCASAATHIACAADRVVMSRQCLYMIHSAGGYAGFLDANSAEKFLQVTEAHNATQVDIYVRKTGKTPEEIATMIANETWMTAAAALEAGFVDELTDRIDLDLTLPGDVRDYYASYYYDDDYWYARYDKATGQARPEREVFTASVQRITASGAQIIGQTAAAAGQQVDPAATTPKPDNPNKPMSFLQKITALLSKEGYIEKDQVAAATDAVEKAAPQFMASLVAEVRAELQPNEAETATAATQAPSITEMLKDMSEEDLAAVRDLLKQSEAVEVDAEAEAAETEAMAARAQELEDLKKENADMKAQIKAVTDRISAQAAGRAATTATVKKIASQQPPASNGAGEVNPGESSDGVKASTESADYKMAKRMYESRQISAQTFQQMTGHEAPAR